MAKFINPFTDIGFKRIFGQEISKPVLMEGQYQDGMEKGRAEGLAEGRAEERLANARSLLANGVPMDVIVKSLGLTPEEINILSKK